MMMFNKALIASLVIVGAASSAHAAPVLGNLTSVKVTGPTGTVWNTTVDSYYTLFIQQPIGTTLNPNDQAINAAAALGTNNFLIAGDGWPVSGPPQNSDSIYNITLGFSNGVTLNGSYVPTTFLFTGGNSVYADSVRYTLTGFGWQRIPFVNVVSPFQAVSGGNSADYLGAFSFTATAVPEPMTWAMMLLGMGMIGGSLRYRRRTTKVSFG